MTDPLRNLLRSRVDFNAIDKHLSSGLLRGLALTATNYASGTAISFFDGDPVIEPWIRSTRMSARVRLEVEHAMASSAIPVFFPAVSIQETYYGDGCIRMNTPMSPAIHMGADRVLAIGVRYERSAVRVSELNFPGVSH